MDNKNGHISWVRPSVWHSLSSEFVSQLDSRRLLRLNQSNCCFLFSQFNLKDLQGELGISSILGLWQKGEPLLQSGSFVQTDSNGQDWGNVWRSSLSWRKIQRRHQGFSRVTVEHRLIIFMVWEALSGCSLLHSVSLSEFLLDQSFPMWFLKFLIPWRRRSKPWWFSLFFFSFFSPNLSKCQSCPIPGVILLDPPMACSTQENSPDDSWTP